MWSLKFLLAGLAVLVETVSCGNILAIFPHTGKSHFFMFMPFITRLSERGHQITLISHFPVTPPAKNINFISLEGTASQLLFNTLSLKDNQYLTTSSKIMTVETLNKWGQNVCDSALKHPPVRRLIESKPRFDLVLVEFFNTDCFTIFSYLFDAPLAGIFSSVLMPWHYDRLGNPDNPSYIVNHLHGYPSVMTLPERVVNTALTFFTKIYFRIFSNWPTDAIIRKHLGDGLPSVSEVTKNTSIFLVNSHFSLFQARPLVPGVIEVGGLHVSPGKKLPSHLEDYLSKSRNGVIVFSLGSTVLGSSIPEEKRLAFARAFKKLSLNVIWKWEEETMQDKPSNVLLQKWIPQNDLLAHPKVKLFITHSGLMGTEEAVYHGVPMVMIPLFGDQPINAASCLEKGLGVVLHYDSITEESFLRAVRTVLENKSYSERSKYVSETFRDRPISVMDNAVYWTEYVIKYKGAPHLRTAAVHLPWYSEYLLDVFFVFCSGLFISLQFILLLWRLCSRSNNRKSIKEKKN